jgi:hypothetical protein
MSAKILVILRPLVALVNIEMDEAHRERYAIKQALNIKADKERKRKEQDIITAIID